jgi:hypothetical protein
MASFVKFEAFTEHLAEKVHNLDADTLKVYLTNATPNVATNTVKADLAEITMTNEANHGAGGADTQNSTSRSGGVTSVVGVDATFLATGGTVGPFAYAVLYNDTTASDNLIGYWPYGSAITLADGEDLLVNFGSSMFTIT